MRQDVGELKRFYASDLGRCVVRMIARRLEAAWPDIGDCDVLGLGYAAPWLEAFRPKARRVICAAPAQQGTPRWPGDGRAMSVLVEETALPFREAMFDRVLAVHLVEEAESLGLLLQSLVTVLAPEGRLILVVANRTGMWARAEATPFGHGRAFSRRQVAQLLKNAGLQPVGWSRAVYLPPHGVLGVPVADAWERVGEWCWPGFGGVIMVEAIRRQWAPMPPSGRLATVGPFVPAIQRGPVRRDVRRDTPLALEAATL